MRAATAPCRPPAPATTTSSPTLPARSLPSGSARHVETRERLHQAEAGHLVEAEHVARHDAAAAWLSHTVSASVTR